MRNKNVALLILALAVFAGPVRAHTESLLGFKVGDSKKTVTALPAVSCKFSPKEYPRWGNNLSHQEAVVCEISQLGPGPKGALLCKPVRVRFFKPFQTVTDIGTICSKIDLDGMLNTIHGAPLEITERQTGTDVKWVTKDVITEVSCGYSICRLESTENSAMARKMLAKDKKAKQAAKVAEDKTKAIMDKFNTK